VLGLSGEPGTGDGAGALAEEFSVLPAVVRDTAIVATIVLLLCLLWRGMCICRRSWRRTRQSRRLRNFKRASAVPRDNETAASSDDLDDDEDDEDNDDGDDFEQLLRKQNTKQRDRTETHSHRGAGRAALDGDGADLAFLMGASALPAIYTKPCRGRCAHRKCDG
jgi:hypothetical protein